MQLATDVNPILVRPCGLAASVTLQLGRVVDIAAAALVGVEIIILFVGVVARFGFDAPLIWSDELASILFLWLAMLGAVVAYRRLEHMRMGALVDRSKRLKPVAEWLALAASLTLLGLLIYPAFGYAMGEAAITTPGLGISNLWRAAALPAGLGLMLAFGLLRMTWSGRLADVALAFGIVVLVSCGFFFAKPLLVAMGNYKLIVFFVLLVGAAVLSGIPIAFAFGLGTFSYLALTTHTPLTVVVSRMDEGMSHLILLAVPLFIFLGLIIEITGMARAMVNFLASLLGHVRGGLQYVLVAAMYLVSGISGAKAADMAAVAPVLFPEMKRRGAEEGDLIALLSATGAQTETIPPSLVLITIGSVTGVSISALFTGGLLPGLVLAVMLCGMVRWRYRKECLAGVQRAPLRQIASALLVALPALVLPFVIRAAVVGGVTTATEVSTIGIAYVLLYGLAATLLFRQQVDWGRLGPALVDTACLSGAVLLIIGTATAMAWALTQSGFSRQIAATMTGLPGGSAMFMAASIVTFIVLGSVLEGIPAIVLFGPLLFPVAKLVGIHEVHYAIVVILSMGIGLFMPPFGVGYYSACAISRVDPAKGIRPILPYMAVLFAGTVLIAAVPWISTGFLRN